MGGHSNTARQVGFRRVDFVRVVCDGDRRTYEVHGARHRLPVIQQVSLATLTLLAARGVPVVVREVPKAS